jgi:hypothetical protein
MSSGTASGNFSFARRSRAVVCRDSRAGLTLNEQAQSFLEAHRFDVGESLLLGERGGHAAQAQLVKLLDSRMSEHVSHSMIVVGPAHVGVRERQVGLHSDRRRLLVQTVL